MQIASVWLLQMRLAGCKPQGTCGWAQPRVWLSSASLPAPSPAKPRLCLLLMPQHPTAVAEPCPISCPISLPARSGCCSAHTAPCPSLPTAAGAWARSAAGPQTLTVLLSVCDHKLYFQPNKFFMCLESCQLSVSQAPSTCHKCLAGTQPGRCCAAAAGF